MAQSHVELFRLPSAAVMHKLNWLGTAGYEQALVCAAVVTQGSFRMPVDVKECKIDVTNAKSKHGTARSQESWVYSF